MFHDHGFSTGHDVVSIVHVMLVTLVSSNLWGLVVCVLSPFILFVVVLCLWGCFWVGSYRVSGCVVVGVVCVCVCWGNLQV